jgi:hypothetical protein
MGDGKYIKLYLIAGRLAEMRQVRLLAWNAIRSAGTPGRSTLLNSVGGLMWRLWNSLARFMKDRFSMTCVELVFFFTTRAMCPRVNKGSLIAISTYIIFSTLFSLFKI